MGLPPKSAFLPHHVAILGTAKIILFSRNATTRKERLKGSDAIENIKIYQATEFPAVAILRAL
jgi:hypothetical protein